MAGHQFEMIFCHRVTFHMHLSQFLDFPSYFIFHQFSHTVVVHVFNLWSFKIYFNIWPDWSHLTMFLFIRFSLIYFIFLRNLWSIGQSSLRLLYSLYYLNKNNNWFISFMSNWFIGIFHRKMAVSPKSFKPRAYYLEYS